MQIHLEIQEVRPVDATTKAAIEQAQAEIRAGKGFTLEQSRLIVRKQYEEWQKTQRNILAA